MRMWRDMTRERNSIYGISIQCRVDHMGYTMDMLVKCHNFGTILCFIFGQTYAYFVSTLPQYKQAKMILLAGNKFRCLLKVMNSSALQTLQTMSNNNQVKPNPLLLSLF